MIAADNVARALSLDRVSNETRFITDHDDGELHGTVLIPDLIYQYQQRDTREPGDPVVTLTIYLRVGELGGVLWSQETRALHRIGGMGHRGLPELIDSGVLPDPTGGLGSAYVRTRAYRSFFTSPTDPAHGLRGKPALALSHLWMLADALAVMHSSQLAHRALWPGALAGDHNSLRITRFEMSGMLANLLRARRSDGMTIEAVREFYLERLPERSRAFAPPERLDFMFGKRSSGLGDISGDVFSLGMIAAEWLLGPELFDGPAGTRDEVAVIQERVRRTLNVDTTLPIAVTAGILEMIATETTNRSTAGAASSVFGSAYDRVAAAEGDDELVTRPHVVGFLPNYVDKTIKAWGYTSLDSMTPSGRDAMAEFIESDMRGARVVWSQSGAVNYVRGSLPQLKQARTVIVGSEIIWFCNDGFVEGPFGKEDIPAVQTILFVREATPALIRRLLDGALYRQLHSVEVVSHGDPYETVSRAARTGPSWAPLLDSTRIAMELPEAAQLRIDALRWYLEYKRALQAGREYAYEIRDGGTLTRPQLHWDREADVEKRGRAEKGLSRLVVRDSRRPSLVDFFGSAEDDQGSVRVEVFRRAEFGTGRGETVGEFELDDIIGSEIVVLRNTRNEKLDPKGWIRLTSDRGDEPQLMRQARATEELAERTDLLKLLVDPTGSKLALNRWTGAGGDLEGDGPARVIDLLEHEPIFVLQGPPGTGKTELTSEAVAAYLRREQGARVLVSAQSHDALDNLAMRILRKLGMTSRDRRTAEYVALRVASRGTLGGVGVEMSEWTEDATVERTIAELKSHAQHWLTHRTTDEIALVPNMERWLAGIDRLDLDLRARIRKGANLVFATTGQSTRENLVDRGAEEPFDWVIVEEAGRAWPTELALPLVRGNRWTLIGDHAQIGPYALNDVRRFITDLSGDDDEELSGVAKNVDHYMAAFNTFGTLMSTPGDDRPRRTLREQYRMTSQIASVVSEAFYKETGGLDTPRPDQDHGYTEPAWAAGQSLIWIDTENAQAARGFWSNEHEAEVVAEIVRSFSPRVSQSTSLAILTPYRKQVSLLQQRLSEHSSQIHTVDSYQGLEADIVVASLVRDRDVGQDRPAYAHVGHLADPGRTNVLLSRARRLLIIVGRFSVYDTFGGDEWRDVTRAVARNGRIVSLSKWSR